MSSPLSASELADLDSSDSLSSVPPSALPSPVPPAPPPPPAPPVVESLVAGRARRANAGNLLAKLLSQEIDEEDTLFLEDEDDVEFEVKEERGREDDDDALMEESSDDDEYDAAATVAGGAQDEVLEGEKVLLAEEREEKKARKRKAEESFLKPRRPAKERKVVIPTAPKKQDAEEEENAEYSALTRPRKKSERISWVPEFVATRASSRTLSLQNRSETMRRLEESEKRRLHTIALMERAAAKKEKVHPKREMTQEERLQEAKITERRNKKSLFSWEETEKAKLEEQRLRLAALQNRKLAGPVITYWSGAAEWSGETGRLVKVGRGLVQEIVEEEEQPSKKARKKKTGKEKEKEKEKAGDDILNTIQVKAEAKATTQTQTQDGAAEKQDTQPAPPPAPTMQEPAASASATAKTIVLPPQSPPPAEAERKDPPSFLDGALDYALRPSQQQPPAPQPSAQTPTPANPPAPSEPPQSSPQLPQDQAPPPPPPLPSKPNEVSARNLIVLENFDPSNVKDRASLIKVLWGEQQRRLPTAKPYCLISQRPAKFRDPATGMPFASLHAYREIRRLLHGQVRWSHLLGAYVGETGNAAVGVPEGF